MVGQLEKKKGEKNGRSACREEGQTPVASASDPGAFYNRAFRCYESARPCKRKKEKGENRLLSRKNVPEREYLLKSSESP